MQKTGSSLNTGGHILAKITHLPVCEKVLHEAANAAKESGSQFTALYIRSDKTDKLRKEDRECLQKYLRIADELGAEIVSLAGDEAERISEFARLCSASVIYIENSKELITRLSGLSPELKTRIVDTPKPSLRLIASELISRLSLPGAKSWWITVLALLLSSLVGLAMRSLKLSEANIITVYILGALIVAIFVRSNLCGAIYSLLSVSLFNLLFTEPRLSFHANGPNSTITFTIMFSASLITAGLANRLSAEASRNAAAARRTGIVLRANQLLQKAESTDAVISIMANHLQKLLARNIIVYPAEDSQLKKALLFPLKPGDEMRSMQTPQEEVIARLVLQSKNRAGAGTDRRGDALGLYMAVRTERSVFCIVGIQIGIEPISLAEKSIITSILGEAALAIERFQTAMEKEAMSIMAKNEKLRANLLRSISHDLRTPLTAISGNAEYLLTSLQSADDVQRRLLSNIYEDSHWLIELVENILSITRLSDGQMHMNMSEELIDEVLQEALRHTKRKSEKHRISYEASEGILLAKMDARLIMQVLFNLIDNAIKYTPEGSEIKLSTEKSGKSIVIKVADNGPGIPDEAKGRIFDMFYTGENKVADCRRSMGLGLALCRTIINLHGGEISVADNEKQGSVFSFTLPASEVNLNE